LADLTTITLAPCPERARGGGFGVDGIALNYPFVNLFECAITAIKGIPV